MAVQDKAYRLFKYISQVFAIDLPVERDVRQFNHELWWQADIIPSQQCRVKECYDGIPSQTDDETTETVAEDVWLVVSKRAYDGTPELPFILKDWVDVSSNPNKEPISKPSLVRDEAFEQNPERLKAFDDYLTPWLKWKEGAVVNRPKLPIVLDGWLDKTRPDTLTPEPIKKRQIEEKFLDDKARVQELKVYGEGPWKTWSEKVKPFYTANILYDQLFSLYQTLSVEGDRLEIVWGHILLSWGHSRGNTVYYPLLLTPMNLSFDPLRRTMTLSPTQTTPTRLSLECLGNLDYALKDDLTKYSLKVNEDTPEPWNHSSARGIAFSITGFLSKEPAEKTTLYSEKPVSRPFVMSYPTVHNTPVIFVRERTRRLWVEDAKKVAEAIYRGAKIPPFIISLLADEAEYADLVTGGHSDTFSWDEDDGENYLPLLYNDQQKEIVDNLKKYFGVLVQGPPGTGKSHTIANIISSLLARGMKVLVTSQTENALKVLRDYIPWEIRSLCVSHVGSDTESKRQMNDALTSIGNHFSDKDSKTKEAHIKAIRQELEALRKEQARIRNQIKDWVALDSKTICIDGTTLTAQGAAKECSENEKRHSWFPDKLPPECEPPLDDQELVELCTLFREVTPSDRISLEMHMPSSENLLFPESLKERLSELNELERLLEKAEPARKTWTDQLTAVRKDQAEYAITLLRAALDERQEIKEPWQNEVLDLMVKEPSQEIYWKGFFDMCDSLRRSAWKAYEVVRDHDIRAEGLPHDFDSIAALDNLEAAIGKGLTPDSFLGRIRLSMRCKAIYRSITVNGQALRTMERVRIAKAHFSYSGLLSQVEAVWLKTITNVEGPVLNLSCPMPLKEIDEKCRLLQYPVQWKTKNYEKLRGALGALGCRMIDFHTVHVLGECITVLESQRAAIEKNVLLNQLDKYQATLQHEASKRGTHPLWSDFSLAIQSRALEQYERAFADLRRLEGLQEKVSRIKELSGKLNGVAPLWYDSLERKASRQGPGAIEEDWRVAWRWQRLNQWLTQLHSQESVDVLQMRLERLMRNEREKIIELVKERTWQRQIKNIQDYQFRALVSWADAMRRYGKTGGKYAEHWLSRAVKAMQVAVRAVPAWIMPLHRVVQSFPAESGIFDVVIVDEASQCDMKALPVLFRGKKSLSLETRNRSARLR